MRRENKKQGGGILPPGYTQLLYIESTGTQWIKIPDYYPSTSSIIKGTFRKEIDLTSIFQAGKDSRRIMMLPVRDNRIDYCYGTGYKSLTIQQGDCSKSTVYDFEITYNKLTINGHTYTIEGTPGIVPDICLHLFSNYFNPEFTIRPNAIYGLTIDDPLSRKINLVPALRLYDSKTGLYDAESNMFYTNNGTGEFLYA